MKYQLISVTMAKNQNTGNNKCWQVCGEKGILTHCWLECKWVLPLWKIWWRSLKSKHKLAIRSSNSIKKNEHIKSQAYLYHHIYRNTVTIANIWNQPNVCHQILDKCKIFCHLRRNYAFFFNKMNPLGGHHIEWNKLDPERHNLPYVLS